MSWGYDPRWFKRVIDSIILTRFGPHSIGIRLLRRVLEHFGPQLDVENAKEVSELPADLLNHSRPFRVLIKHGIVTLGPRGGRPYVWLAEVGMIRDFHDHISDTCSLKTLCRRLQLHDGRPVSYDSVRNNEIKSLPEQVRQDLCAIGYPTRYRD